MNRFRTKTTRADWWGYAWSGFYFITICTYRRLHYFGKIVNGKMQLSQCGIIADRCWNDIPKHHHNVELGAYVVMPNHIHGILILTGSRLGPSDAINLRPEQTMGNIMGPSDAINPRSEKIMENVMGPSDAIDSQWPGNIVGSLHATILQSHQQMDNAIGPSDAINPRLEKTIGNILGPSDAINPRSEQTMGNAMGPSEAINPHSEQSRDKNRRMSFISPRSASVAAIVRSYKSAVTRQANLMGFRNGWQSKYYDRIIRDDKEYHRLSQYIINNPLKWGRDKNNHVKAL